MTSTRYFSALIGACLFVTGCVSSSTTHLINNYSVAAGSLDSAIGQTYAEAQQVEADSRIASALNDPDTGYASFCKSHLKTESIAVRTKLADELLGYSKSLRSLVSDPVSADIATQSQALFTNLSSLNSTFGTIAGHPPLSQSDLAIVAAVVDAIGQAWAQNERLKLLAEIVEEADPLVQQASKLYVEDLDNWQDFEIEALENVSRDYFKIAQTKISPSGAAPTFPDASTRITLLQKADTARNDAAAVPAKFQGLRDAMQKCAKAHGAVLASLKSDTQLKASASVVSDFEVSVQQVYTFYQGVAK